MVTDIIIVAIVVGIPDILIGIFLGIVSEKLKVEVDEKEILVRSELLGSNCGGCGYAGCDALAKVIVAGQADVGAYPVGGASTAEKIGVIMGVVDGAAEKKATFVKCKGSCDKTVVQYNYYSVDDCKKVSVVPGAGEEACTYGCMGYSSCAEACAFDAIRVVDGVAAVDKEKYAACGKRAASCLNHLIELVSYKAEHLVQCSSYDKGKDAKAVCAAGCIGCTLCMKQYEFNAIHIENNLVVIDYEKCINCGKRAEKCSIKVIVQAR